MGKGHRAMKGCEATGRIMLVIAFLGVVGALLVPYVGPVIRFLRRAGVVLVRVDSCGDIT